MTDAAADTVATARPCPVTSEARRQLVEEIARVRGALTSLTGQGLEEGIVRLPFTLDTHRLTTLRDLLARAEVVDEVACVAIGRRVTLSEAGGDTATYDVVLPDSGGPADGCISVASPLGTAILGARVGDVVDVVTAAGRRSVRVLAID